MKVSSSCVQVLSLATLALAAPHTARKQAEAVPFPPEELMPKFLTFEEASNLMDPSTAANTTDTEDLVSLTSAAAADEGGMQIQAGCRRDIRMRWATMSAGQRSAFVGAIKCLTQRPARGGIWNQARTRWDELTWVHATMNNEIHQLDLFLPWHRYYLYAFKTMLSEDCGYNGPIAWWRETNNAGNFAASDIFSSQYFGTLPQADANGNGRCVTDGAFAGLTQRVSNPNSPQCVARGEIKAETNYVTFAYEDLCHGGAEGVTFPRHRSCVELTNHSRMHRGFGPTMANAAISPADPVFFLHHSYVDWQWKRWQNLNSARWTTISGCADKRSPCTPLTRNTVLTSRGLIRDMTVGEILDTEGELTCYTYDDLL